MPKKISYIASFNHDEILAKELERYSLATGIPKTNLIKMAVKIYMNENPIEKMPFYDELMEMETYKLS